MNVGLELAENNTLFQSNVCRLCSLISEKVLPVFDNSGDKFYMKIKECLPSLEIRQGDGKPQQICLDCITKVNMFCEFLQRCVQAEYKFETYLQNDRHKQVNSSKMNNNSDCLWLDDVSSKSVRQSVGTQNDAGVIVLSKLDSTFNDPSSEDYVVMVELKYKDTPPTHPNSLESTLVKAPLTMMDDSPDLINFDSLLDLDSMKENANKLHDNTSMDLFDKQNKSLNDERRIEFNSNKLVEKAMQDNKSLECGVCNRTFKRRTRLNSHMARHTEVRPFKCKQCDKSFVMKWELNLHDRIHSRTYACLICNKVFGSKSKLSRHGRVHSGERPYPCSECGKAFGEKRNLDNHIRTHSGDRPYSCQLCGKTFNVRSHMVDHLNVHKRTPRFQCPSCTKSFKWKTNYNRHVRIHKLDESFNLL